MKFANEKARGLFIEFGLGVPLNVLFATALYFWILPDYQNVGTEVERLLFALKCNGLPVLALLLGVFAVALSRVSSSENDPLKMEESRSFKIHLRYLTNTHEQLVLFFISSLVLSIFLDESTVGIIPVAAILFFVNRVLFWVGYLKDPMLRGFGLAGTMYPITFMVLTAAYLAVKTIFIQA